MTYVFVGSISEAPGIKLTRFGQRVELPPELAEETTHHGGLLCIPAEEFDPLMEECKVDAAMLKKWGSPGAYPNSPDAFKALVKRSREVLHDQREPVRQKFLEARAAAIAAQALAETPKEAD